VYEKIGRGSGVAVQFVMPGHGGEVHRPLESSGYHNGP
jgi:hypothetical protein